MSTKNLANNGYNVQRPANESRTETQHPEQEGLPSSVTLYTCLDCGTEYAIPGNDIPDYCPNCSPQHLPPARPKSLKDVNFDLVARVSISAMDDNYPLVEVVYDSDTSFVFTCTAKEDHGLSWLVVTLSELEWPSLTRFAPGSHQIDYVGPKHISWQARKDELRDKITLLSSDIIAKSDHKTGQDIKVMHRQLFGNRRLSTMELRQAVADLETILREVNNE